MKAEINNETKAAFMALYLNAETSVPEEYDEDGWYVSAILTGVLNGGHEAELQLIDQHGNACETETVVSVEQVAVKLKAIADITDEDAEVIAIQNKFNGSSKEVAIKVGRDILKRVFIMQDTMFCLPMESADYLRSRSYLIGFRGLTAEEIVAAGWAKA